MENGAENSRRRSPTGDSPPHKRPAPPSPGGRRPAFNPGLLASPFYCGPTMYGGAGACNSASPHSRFTTFYERRKPDVKVTPAKSDVTMSRTSKRICELLAQYSSPISDAKRAPAIRTPAPSISNVGNTPTSGGTPRRLRELRVPSMATLLELKRNNRMVGSAQAAIAASLSSSLPYNPEDYSLRNDSERGSNFRGKIKTRITGRSKDIKAIDIPEPVNLPNISLNVPGSEIPRIILEPFAPLKPKLLENGPSEPSVSKPTYKCEEINKLLPLKKFTFRDPFDPSDHRINQLKYINMTGFSSEKSKLEEVESIKPKLPSKHILHSPPKSETYSKIPINSWNGTINFSSSSNIKNIDISKKVSHDENSTSKLIAPLSNNKNDKTENNSSIEKNETPSLADFIKKQKSQWECNSCLSRNDNDKIKCVCCEAPKPGASSVNKSDNVENKSQNSIFNLPTSKESGLASFIQKQKSQWECSCCMTRNDPNRNKCVCCEMSKPGAPSDAPSTATNFVFGTVSTQTFKFGVDKNDNQTTNTTLATSINDDKKSNIESSKGFTFGIPTTSVKSDVKSSEISFGIANGSIPVDSSKSESCPNIVSNSIFKNESLSKSVISSPFSFGFKPTPEKESADVKKPEVEQNNKIAFKIPEIPKIGSQEPNSDDKNKSENLKEINEPQKITDNDQKNIETSLVNVSSPISTLSTVSSVDSKTQPVFAFGSPQQSTVGFGNTPQFNFGSNITPSTSTNTTTDTLKSPNLFNFGAKTETAVTDSKIVSNTNVIFSTTDKNISTSIFSTASPNNAQLTTSTSLKDLSGSKDLLSNSTPNLQFQSPTTEKSKETLPNPVFSFSSPTNNSAFKNNSTPSGVFTFGANPSNTDQSKVPIFGSQTPSTNIFGTQSSENKSPNTTSLFTKNLTTTASFSSPTGSIFGSKPTNTNAPISSGSLFGNNTAESKSPSMFGSQQINNSTTSQSLQSSGKFMNEMQVPTFNAGNIFGSSLNNSIQQPTLFNIQNNNNKPLTNNESGTGMFGNKTQTPMLGAFFGGNQPSSTPLSTGGIFGSHPGVPTPVFGASIPFDESPQTQTSQNTPFNFGAPNPSQTPVVGFGQAPAAGSSAPVFSFGSNAASTSSQFNFSMGAPTPSFSNTPGVNSVIPGRRFKKAVRRNVPPR